MQDEQQVEEESAESSESKKKMSKNQKRKVRGEDKNLRDRATIGDDD